MNSARSFPDLGVEVRDHVAIVEMRRPPHNFFDQPMVAALADSFEALDANPEVRAIVLCAQGSAFCAGADFSKSGTGAELQSPDIVNPIYNEALRLFEAGKPVIAAIHGAAVGGGLGLALAADFRVGCTEARFAANFSRLGISPGFGLTTTLPRLVGIQQAANLFYTGRRIGGDEAFAIGLVDMLAPQAEVRERALAFAAEIAQSAPLSVKATRTALRRGLVDEIRAAVVRESADQFQLFRTADFKEGVAATAARRTPDFRGA